MRPYEVMAILDPKLEDAETENVIERLRQVVTDRGGEVTSLDKWGRRRLAYEIKGNQEAYYLVMRFKAPVEATRELERVMRITDAVLRYLLVRLDED